ncbi:MAG: peptidoglycan DD-metalloendopeptidase family protein [Sphingomicrobium sp.]
MVGGSALALVALAAAGFASAIAYAPAQARATIRIDGSQWSALAIAPAVQGHRTGLRVPASGYVEPLAVAPPRRAPRRASAAAGSAARPPLIVSAAPVRVTGRVGPNLNATLEAAGVSRAVVAQYVEALARSIDLSDGLSVEDRFDVVIGARDSGDGGYTQGQLLYAGLDRLGRSDVQLLRWSDRRDSQWLDAGGVGRSSGGVTLPVSGRVTSGFGGRQHPILGYFRFHRGVDIGASWGAPVIAAADGRVTGAGWSGGYGRQVRLAHGGGVATAYSHLSGIVARPGSLIRQGQLLGFVGSSGLSTGPHLHYDVFKDGRPVNPLVVRMAVQSQLRGDQFHAFRERLRHLLSLKQRTA